MRGQCQSGHVAAAQTTRLQKLWSEAGGDLGHVGPRAQSNGRSLPKRPPATIRSMSERADGSNRFGRPRRNVRKYANPAQHVRCDVVTGQGVTGDANRTEERRVGKRGVRKG